MSRKSEAIKAAIAIGHLRVYDESMDDPSDENPWSISIPGSYTVAKFRDGDTARVVFDALTKTAKVRIFNRWPTLDWHIFKPLRGDGYRAFWFGPFKIVVRN